MNRLPGPRTPLGHLVEGLRLARDPYDGMLDLYRRYGPVAAVGYRPLRYVYLLGREANEFILSSHHHLFEWREALKALIPVEGETALVVTDGEEHDRRRRLVQPAFALKQVESYQPIIAEEAAACSRRVIASCHTDLADEFKRTIRRIAIRTLFGDTLGERAEDIGDALQAAIDYANLPPFLVFNHGLFPPYRKAMRATRVVDDIVYAEIDRRRSSGDHGEDLLGRLLDAANGDDVLSDAEIRDQVVSLIAGGYETTTALAAWAAYALLTHPDVLEELREELSALDDLADPVAIKDCNYLDAVINETLRLYGPAPFSARHAPQAFEFSGHRIAAGTIVVFASSVTHRHHDWWDDPEAFRPERWFVDDEPPPYVFIPFGGGYRKCIGFAMAGIEAKTILADLFRSTTMELTTRRVRPAGYATMRPSPGVRVKAHAVGARAGGG